MTELAPSTEGGLIWLPFAASQLGCWEDPAGAHQARPHTAAEALLRNPDALAALDGPMFEVTDRAHPRYRDYATGRLDYRLYESEGIAVDDDGGTRTDGRGITLSVVGGVAQVLDGDCVALHARAAVQLYPTLIRHKAVVAGERVNRDAVWRAGVAVLGDGSLAFAVMRASMRAFAQALLAKGAVDAGYTDGGGSARLQLASGRWWGSTENRRVLSWLLVRKAA